MIPCAPTRRAPMVARGRDEAPDAWEVGDDTPPRSLGASTGSGQTVPRHLFHQRTLLLTLCRVHPLEEQQLGGEAPRAGWTPRGCGPIQHHEFLGIQGDQRALGRGEAGWIKDPALDGGDVMLPPIVVTMVLC